MSSKTGGLRDTHSEGKVKVAVGQSDRLSHSSGFPKSQVVVCSAKERQTSGEVAVEERSRIKGDCVSLPHDFQGHLTRKRAAKEGHLPSLDGLRAVSIGLVLLGHLSGTRRFVWVDLGVGNYAQLGVVVFFVISGFLITRLMLLERAKNGSVSLKHFYERRALRLFPASYAFIGCVCLLSIAGIVHLHARDIWHAVTYTVNFLPGRGKEIGHLWSLSVEEQFYLLWPCTFVMLGRRRASWVAAGVILLGPVARSCDWLFLRDTAYHRLQMFPMVADSLAMGCLLASFRSWLEGRNWYLQLFRPVFSLGLLALVLLINRFLGYTVVYAFGTSVINLSLALLIHRCVYCSGDLIGKVLNWKPIAFVGVLSYSLYLWQQLFLNRESSAWVNTFPQNLVLAVAAALGSYFLLEKPLLNLRRRLRASGTSVQVTPSRSA